MLRYRLAPLLVASLLPLAGLAAQVAPTTSPPGVEVTAVD